MKKLKILFSMICAIAIISSLCVPAFAYSDGDREVLYYNFNIGTGELVGCSSSSMKRLYNREWVVTVSSRSNNRYTITYGMLDNNATEWDNALVSNTTSRSGTGNFGSTYPSSSSIGSRLYLGALINFNDVNRGVKTSGQWSTDAAREFPTMQGVMGGARQFPSLLVALWWYI